MTRDDRLRDEVARLRGFLGVAPDAHDTQPLSREDELLLTRIVSGAALKPARSEPRREPERSRLAARIAVACVTVVALVVGALALQSGQAPAVATPAMLRFSSVTVEDVIAGDALSAEGTLRSIALATSRKTPLTGGGDQQVKSYAWYLTTVVDAEGQRTVELAPTFQTMSVHPDGSVTNQEKRAPALSLDGRVIDPDHYPAGGDESEDSLPPGTQDPGFPASLPRDPDSLRAAIVAAQGGPDLCLASDMAEAQCLYAGIVDLFTRWVVPSDLAAALWQVFADSPVVVDLGNTTDRLGREGSAVALPPDPTGANQVQILVIDPTSGQLLAWEQVSTAGADPDMSEPFVSGFQSIVSSAWVAP